MSSSILRGKRQPNMLPSFLAINRTGEPWVKHVVLKKLVSGDAYACFQPKATRDNERATSLNPSSIAPFAFLVVGIGILQRQRLLIERIAVLAGNLCRNLDRRFQR